MIFGGQGETEKPEVDQPYETLDDLVIWDTEQEKWELPQLEVAEGVRRPAARHAHLSAVVSFNTTPHSPATIASSPSLSPFRHPRLQLSRLSAVRTSTTTTSNPQPSSTSNR